MKCTNCKGTGEIHGTAYDGQMDWEAPCPACKGKGEINLSAVTNIRFEGIDTKDYPDFCDAFICECDYEGEPASEELLQILNDEGSFVHEKLFAHLT